MVGKLDNEQMKMIWRNYYGEVLIEDVEVLRETERRYVFQSEHTHRSILDKNEIDMMLDGKIFTFNLPKAIDIWNDWQTNRIANLESDIEKIRRLIITTTL